MNATINAAVKAALETTKDPAPFIDVYSLLGIGTIIVAIVSIATLAFTIKQSRNINYLEFVKNTDIELSKQLEKELELKGKEQCIVYTYNYIDLCDRIMFLIRKRKIPQEFFEYYRDFFNYAVTMIWGYVKIYPEDEHSLQTSWFTLKEWIAQEDEINPYPLIHLPLEMKKILKENGIDLNQNTIKKDLKEFYGSNYQKNKT